MKTRLKLFLPVLAAAISFTSCSDDDTDTQKPTIVIQEPHAEEEVAPGGELHIEAIFTDNVELASYKIEIHEDFDDHTHAVYKNSHDVNPWSYDKTFEIPAGLTTFEAVEHLDIPTEINGEPISEGTYHLGIYVTDAAGNEQQEFLEFHIEDDHGGETAH